MILFDTTNLDAYTEFPFKCDYCETIFYKTRAQVIRALAPSNAWRNTYKYCSQKCHHDANNKQVQIICKQCGKERLVVQTEIKKNKTGNFFCNSSCAATYNNTHKTTGSRVSKLELWLKEKLAIQYPNLEIKYCDKTAINSELDIYIPSLKLAFELNGIYHYEPIHCQNKLDQIQNNDKRKYQACIERGIDLCIIDVSNLKYFKERNCVKYLNIITDIINTKL